MEYDCLACVGEHIASKANPKPEIRKAITLAPQWVQQQMMGQVMISAVAVPTCYEHLNVQEESALQKATRNGLLLGGQSPQ